MFKLNLNNQIFHVLKKKWPIKPTCIFKIDVPFEYYRLRWPGMLVVCPKLSARCRCVSFSTMYYVQSWTHTVSFTQRLWEKL